MGLVMPTGKSAPAGICSCGSAIPAAAAFCPSCGRNVRPLCGICNGVFADNSKFCTACGAPRTFARPDQCPTCTIRLIGGGNFCTGCGQLIFRLCGTCGTRQLSGWIHCPVCNRPAESQETLTNESGEVPPAAIPAVGGGSPSALAEVLNQEGANAFEAEQFEDAEEFFRRASELDPEEPLYLTNLAAALGELDRAEEAEATLLNALKIDPDDPATLLAAGIFADDRGRRDEAEAHWRHLDKVAGDSAEAEEARSLLASNNK